MNNIIYLYFVCDIDNDLNIGISSFYAVAIIKNKKNIIEKNFFETKVKIKHFPKRRLFKKTIEYFNNLLIKEGINLKENELKIISRDIKKDDFEDKRIHNYITEYKTVILKKQDNVNLRKKIKLMEKQIFFKHLKKREDYYYIDIHPDKKIYKDLAEKKIQIINILKTSRVFNIKKIKIITGRGKEKDCQGQGKLLNIILEIIQEYDYNILKYELTDKKGSILIEFKD